MKKIIISISFFFTSMGFAQSSPRNANSPEAFVPQGNVISETIRGDLNHDGLEDYVFITKATLKSKFVKDEYRGVLDRNRRGLTIVFKQKNDYKLVYQSKDCFSSENEDGGVYFPPELNVLIEKGNLLVHFAHGRYGYWKYTFRFQNPNFELIGYDSEDNSGPVLLRSVSMNLLTKKMLITKNTNPNYTPEKLESKWTKLNFSKPIELKDFVDFDQCNPSLLEC